MKPLNYYKKPRKSYKSPTGLHHCSIFGGMKVHENIRALRLAKGFTQEQLAAGLHIDVANYSRIERGISKITVDRLEKIARILNLQVADILNLQLSSFPGSAEKQTHLMERNNQLLEKMLHEVKELGDFRNYRVISDMRSALKTNGYFRLPQCSEELLNVLHAELGTVIFTTDVMVKPESSFLVTSAKALDYHTDHHKANYILWYCLKQTSAGGESLLIDAWKAFDALSDSDKKALHEIQLYEHKVFPDDQDSYPLAETKGGRVSLYYSFWLLKKTDKAHPALQAFQKNLKEIQPVKFLLQPRDVLVIDNHRMFHGRTAIEGSRDRFLKRFWIAEENYLFHNHKNQ